MHVVHHSATEAHVTPQQIARYHVETLGWHGIGYHFVIAADGTIYQTNRMQTVSYHAGWHNSYTLGACLVGNFTHYAPTYEQVAALTWLHREWLPERLGPLPLKGHKELMPTACPGDKWDWRAI